MDSGVYENLDFHSVGTRYYLENIKTIVNSWNEVNFLTELKFSDPV